MIIEITGTPTMLANLKGSTHPQPIPNSVAGLLNNAAGRSATPSSDFYTNMKLDSAAVLDRALLMVSRWIDIPRLQQYEYSRVSKYGPQGGLPPLGSDEMVTVITRYYDPTHFDNPCKVSTETDLRMKAFFKDADLRPLTYAEVIQRQLSKHELVSSSGWPLETRRAKVIEEYIEMAQRHEWYHAKAGFRSTRNSVRMVWGMSMADNLQELCWVYPLMDYMIEQDPFTFAPWKGQAEVESKLNTRWKDGKTYLSGDFTKMDTYVGPAQSARLYSWFKQAFPQKYHAQLKISMARPNHVPLVVSAVKTPPWQPTKGSLPPTKGMARGQWHWVTFPEQPHGLASGSGWTSIFETTLGQAMDMEMGVVGPHTPIWAMDHGDDTIKAFDHLYRNLDDVADTFVTVAHRFGLEANPEKQLVSHDECRFLQRVYSPETVFGGKLHGAYPAVLAFNSAKNPERSSYLTGVQRAVRLIEIGENCAGHPHFFDIAREFVKGSDVLMYQATDRGFWKTADSIYQKQVAHGTVEGSHGKQGLENFEFTKLLKGGKLL